MEEGRIWFHRRHINVLKEKEGHLPWLRKAKVSASRVFYDNEGAGDSAGFVDLIVNICLERAGFPPIMGLAVGLDDIVGEEDLVYTVYYLAAPEFHADHAAPMDKPASKMHENEECIDMPEWICPPPKEPDGEEE